MYVRRGLEGFLILDQSSVYPKRIGLEGGNKRAEPIRLKGACLNCERKREGCFNVRNTAIPLRISNNCLLIILLILHVRNLLLIILIHLLLPHLSTLIHRPHILHPRHLTGRQPTRSQPAIVVSPRMSALARRESILNHRLILPGVAGKVLIQSSMTGDPACDQELFAGGKI